MNSARYLTGVGANDTLPSNSQGMGLMDLGRAFDGKPRIAAATRSISSPPRAQSLTLRARSATPRSPFG